MTESSENRVRMPEVPLPGACLVYAGCVDITALVDNSVQPPTTNYCGVGPDAELYSVSEVTPQPSTLTAQGPKELLGPAIRDARNQRCPQPIQIYVDCDGQLLEGTHIRQVRWDVITHPSPVTARGINVTSTPVQISVAAQWLGPEIPILPANEVRPKKVTSVGGFYYQAPMGVIDGINDTFILDPTPVDPNVVVVVLDNNQLVAGVDYTLVGGTIVLAVPPDCGATLMAYWTDCQALLAGMDIVDTQVCDSLRCGGGTCNTGFSDGCSNIYMLLSTNIDDPDNNCGITADPVAVLANFFCRDGSVELLGIQYLGSIVNPRALICEGNDLFVIAQNGIFRTCGSVVPCDGSSCSCGNAGQLIPVVINGANLGARGIVDVAASTDTRTKAYYILFGENGVARSLNNGRIWSTVLQDGQLSTPRQNKIDAAGVVVATAGEQNSLQVNVANGRSGSWVQRTGHADATYNIVDLSLSVTDNTRPNTVIIYTMATNDILTEVSLGLSGNMGVTWELKNQWAITGDGNYQIESEVDGALLYAQIGNQTYRNWNFGCECDWQPITSAEADYPFSNLIVCPNNINRLFISTPDYCFEDRFVDPATTQLGDHIPNWSVTGDGWTVLVGGEFAINNTGEQVEVIMNGVALTNTDKCDVQASVEIIPKSTSSQLGLVLRYVDVDNYMLAIADTLNGLFQIVSFIGGVQTVQATTPFTFNESVSYQIVASIVGPVITATVNGVTSISWGNVPDCDNSTGGQHGIVGHVGDVLDNFVIQ